MEIVIRDDQPYFSGSTSVRELTPQDFDPVSPWKLLGRPRNLGNPPRNLGCTIILFYAPWCPHCKSLKNDWEKLGRTATFMDVAAFNCERYKSHVLQIKEDMPQLIKSYPTITFYSNGQPVEQYDQERDYANLLKACMRVCQSDGL